MINVDLLLSIFRIKEIAKLTFKCLSLKHTSFWRLAKSSNSMDFLIQEATHSIFLNTDDNEVSTGTPQLCHLSPWALGPQVTLYSIT